MQYASNINGLGKNLNTTYSNPINVGGTGTDILSASDYSPTFSGAVTLSNSLTIASVNMGGSTIIISGGITGAGNIVYSSGAASVYNIVQFSNNPVNNIGTITFNNAVVNGDTAGTGAGTNLISGGVGSNVTQITQSSNSNPLTIQTANVNVNTAGTTFNSAGPRCSPSVRT